ncbi:MAG: hypothetical protein U5R48_07245 [Gammaproteobacteria bacterium]|nr:hypothetical protein [Gammaproteobacteria bacterium]
MTTALDWWTFAQDAPDLARSGWPLLQAGQDGRERAARAEREPPGRRFGAARHDPQRWRYPPAAVPAGAGRRPALPAAGGRDRFRPESCVGSSRYGIRARQPAGAGGRR